MKPSEYERCEELFNQAIALPEHEWPAFLEKNCQSPEIRKRVEAMLDADAQTKPAFGTPAMIDRQRALGLSKAEDAVGSIPEMIGRYRIIRALGQGGMGVVYEAEQDHPKRRVALKIMRSDSFSEQMAQRFALESHVLGQLHHPGIAQIFESGVAESTGRPQPYFVMELIHGQSLASHVQLNNVPVRERLSLMAQIADAVHHAHQKGVIHRDLKPENILVDRDGRAKVMDFGVARAIDSDTQVTMMQTDVGQMIGTLAYMSPEQISGRPEQIDTRSDVYAMGVMLYELLGGVLPLDVRRRSIPEAVRMIQEDEPRSLSTLNTRFRGDLDTIVRKAMEKDKERRYQSAAAFAEDIRRYLNDLPIIARPASSMYQLRKFAKRNKALVGGVTAVFIALIVGMVASMMLYMRAEANLTRAIAAEEDALRESAVATEVSNFLVSLFETSDPAQARGRQVTAREMLDRGAERIQTELEVGTEVRGRLLQLMGNVYHTLGAFDAARPLILEAMEIHVSLYEPWHPMALESRRAVARLHLIEGNLHEAQQLLEDGLNVMADDPESDAEIEWRYLNLLSALANRMGRFAESREINERSLLVLDRLKDQALRRELLAQTHHALGVSNYYFGNLEEAESSYRKGIAGFRESYGDEHPNTAVGLSSLGLTLRSLGRHDDAEPMLRESIRIGEIIWGEDSVHLTAPLNNLALTLQDLGRFEEAEGIFRRLIKVYEAVYGASHAITSLGIANLASLVTTIGRFDEAEELLERAKEIRREALGEDHPDFQTIWNLYINMYMAAERWSEAEAVARQQYAYYVERDGEAGGRSLRILSSLAEIVYRQGRLEEAQQLFRQEWTARREHHGIEQDRTLRAATWLAHIRLARGESDEADAFLRQFHTELIEANHLAAARQLAARAHTLYAESDHADAAAAWNTLAEAPSDT